MASIKMPFRIRNPEYGIGIIRHPLNRQCLISISIPNLAPMPTKLVSGICGERRLNVNVQPAPRRQQCVCAIQFIQLIQFIVLPQQSIVASPNLLLQHCRNFCHLMPHQYAKPSKFRAELSRLKHKEHEKTEKL